MLYINTIYERFLHLYVDILSHTLIRNGNGGLFIAYNISEFSRLMNCSRASIYKYIKIAEKG